MRYSSSLLIYITLIAIELMEYNATFLFHCWFLFIPWWEADMRLLIFSYMTFLDFIWNLLWLELCLHFQENKNDLLEYDRASIVDVQ